MKRLTLALLFLFAAAPAMGSLDVLPPPVVVVYPFNLTGSNVDPEVGGRIAVLFATQLASSGGVTVKPATPGTDRPHYIDDARKLGADYYVSGYLTPLGDEVSLVSQVVSTYSGTVVYSSTTQIRTYQEAVGQIDTLRLAIIRHAGRTLAALDAPPPLPRATPTTQPQAGNLSNIFGRHPKATPAPRASATAGASATKAPASVAQATRAPAPPSPPAPGPKRATPTPAPAAVPVAVAVAQPTASSAAIVVVMGGDAVPKDRSYASTAVSAAIAKAGYGGALVTSAMNTDVPARARQLCSQNSAAAIYGGTLSLKHVGVGSAASAAANFELVRYNCAGAVTARHRVATNAGGSSGSTAAIDRAVAESVAALLPAKGS